VPVVVVRVPVLTTGAAQAVAVVLMQNHSLLILLALLLPLRLQGVPVVLAELRGVTTGHRVVPHHLAPLLLRMVARVDSILLPVVPVVLGALRALGKLSFLVARVFLPQIQTMEALPLYLVGPEVLLTWAVAAVAATMFLRVLLGLPEDYMVVVVVVHIA
jgi:hypothetical protein